MSQLTLKTAWERLQHIRLLKHLRTQFGYINTMLTELFADTVVVFPVTLHASKVIHNVLIAKRNYTITEISWVGDIAQAITGTVVKATGTATPASATTPMHTAGGVVCNTTAHTVLNLTLTSTAADLSIVAGERVALVLSGALTTGSGLLMIRMRKS